MIKRVAISGGVFACLIAVWVYSEMRSSKAVRPPAGATNLVAFITSVPRIAEIRKFVHNDKLYLEVIGKPYESLMSVPSGPPAYIFDETGLFVDWSRDLGDQPSFVRKWGGFSNSTPITIEQAKHLLKEHGQ
jgi:hypothetical protein